MDFEGWVINLAVLVILKVFSRYEVSVHIRGSESRGINSSLKENMLDCNQKTFPVFIPV